MFCDLIFLIQRVGSKDIYSHMQTRRAEKRALLKSKIFNLENDKEPLDFPIPGELNKDRDVQPSLRARSSPSVLLWTDLCTFKSVFIHFIIAPNLIKPDFVYLSYERYGNLTSVGAGGEQTRSC